MASKVTLSEIKIGRTNTEFTWLLV